MTSLTIGDAISLGTRAADTWRTRVAWAASDDVGVMSYRVDVRAGSASWTEVYSGGSTGRSLDLPTGAFGIRVRAADAAGNLSAARILSRSATIADMTTTRTTSQTTDWTASTGRSAAWSGTRYVASTAGQRLTLMTDSRMSALIAQQGASGGRIAVYVDGVKVATVDLASAATLDRRVVWSATWSSRATRTIEIRTLDSAGADMVWLDAVLTLR
jgi:hypothetical protein